jgi:hypothetical protein
VHDKKDYNKRDSAHRIDDSKHADAPLPCGSLENRRGQVAANPGIYLKTSSKLICCNWYVGVRLELTINGMAGT